MAEVAGKFLVVKEQGPNGPVVVFRISVDLSTLSAQTSIAETVDTLAEHFLATAAQLGPKLDSPPQVTLVLSGIEPNDSRRIAETKAAVDRMWARKPDVARVLKEKGNNSAAWMVAFVGADEKSFDVHVSSALSALDPDIWGSINKALAVDLQGKIEEDKQPSPPKKPWWKLW